MLNPEMRLRTWPNNCLVLWLSSAPLHRGVRDGAKPYSPGCREGVFSENSVSGIPIYRKLRKHKRAGAELDPGLLIHMCFRPSRLCRPP